MRKRPTTSSNHVLSAFALGLILLFAFGESAVACRSPDSITTAFYDDIPAGIDAQAIAEVVVTGMISNPRYPEIFHTLAWARVLQVYKGALKMGDVIRIIVGLSSCSEPFTVGRRGIVLGQLNRDPEGVLELEVVAETVGDRRKRKS